MKEMLPKVSIVTGFYNREDYVEDSIKSLLNQDYENLEIIIFDDCSTDRTFEKIGEICGDNFKVHLIKHERNLGFVKGMINAINCSSGEFIAVHGSGDISLPNRVSKQVGFLNANPTLVGVGCYYANVDFANDVYKKVKRDGPFDFNCFYKSNPFSHGEVMYRKSVYHKVGGYRDIFKFSQDLDLWLRMSKEGEFGCVKEILYERIINFTGASYSPSKIILQRKYSILAKELNTLGLVKQNEIISYANEIGVHQYINSRHPLVQKHLFYMFNVLSAKNQLRDIEVFLNNSYGIRYYYYYLISYFMNFNFFKYSINRLYKIFINR
ncbi:glycosyltransferase [Algoriphagus halophytocola]|uniref:glycosyltransferase family 2 protein n=1 Tax=Algoriphagus halophytocola TaxID=2991499 RepID=UPI0022DD4F91|nr:glycosyltransferase [Algoriphagus sp. TR-M9]WBL41239.1 glycosyltransferase [Algoriphagus sp. TR-M9]